MKETEFRTWLEARRWKGKPLTSVSSRISKARRFERAMPALGLRGTDLDEAFEGDGLEEVTGRLRDLCRQAAETGEAPTELVGKTINAPMRMNNVAAAVRNYRQFCNTGALPITKEPEQEEPDDEWAGDSDMDDDELLARFEGGPCFTTARKAWTTEQTTAFCAMARAVHVAGLDWYHTNMPHNPVRFGRKPHGDRRAVATLGYLDHRAIPRIWLSDKEGRPQVGTNDFPLDDVSASRLATLLDRYEGRIVSWRPLSPPRNGWWPDEAGFDPDTTPDGRERLRIVTTAEEPTNLILYGPPGTGKTYASAREAVRLCDGRHATDSLFKAGRRSELMKRYRELVDEGRIEFVTFHQSMSYEDFVEGLRPETGAVAAEENDGTEPVVSGGFRLRPRDGIFKLISERARLARRTGSGSRLNRSRSVFKIALGRRSIEEDRITEGLRGGLIHLGWGGTVDWSDERFDSFDEIKRHWQREVDPDATGKDANIETVYTLRASMQTGDYVILSDGRDSIRGVGEVAGDYYYDAEASYHPHRRPVRWLWQNEAGVPRERFYPRHFRRHSTYQLAGDVINWDELDDIVFGNATASEGGGPAHVLVVDEINRANISKVFGELITLLEGDKRIGSINELKVRLPYSGAAFGVPANLHIVGTMNTADRSIALIDKALRRRFVFQEMMPEYEVQGMGDVVANAGVTLSDVLRAMNDRIEYLLDREHRIGHGWLLGCDTKEKLDLAMREKVIPLVAEYFFEDWSRAASVLGGQKDNPFLETVQLPPPPGMADAKPRLRWLLRPTFEEDAYIRLLGCN